MVAELAGIAEAPRAGMKLIGVPTCTAAAREEVGATSPQMYDPWGGGWQLAGI
jgi:beta-phosphoglucomutase-like phosphatase (HAD superfamily)